MVWQAFFQVPVINHGPKLRQDEVLYEIGLYTILFRYYSIYSSVIN